MSNAMKAPFPVRVILADGKVAMWKSLEADPGCGALSTCNILPHLQLLEC
jgi:hypothetical protein